MTGHQPQPSSALLIAASMPVAGCEDLTLTPPLDADRRRSLRLLEVCRGLLLNLGAPLNRRISAERF